MSEVTKQPATPTAADTTNPDKAAWIANDAPTTPGLKIFEPAMKNPVDQLQYTLEQIEALKNPTNSAVNYANAFSPESDQYFVETQTGNALVKASENLAAIFSPPPDGGESEICVPCLLGWIVIGYLAYKFYKRSYS